MKVQLLGVLDHVENERDCPNASLLAEIDKQIIEHFGIWRLSDKRFTAKTRAKGPGRVVANASSRLQLVCALLKSLVMEHSSGGAASQEDRMNDGNSFLSSTYEPPLMIRHESLSREFQGPGMQSPSSTPLYAVFGRAPKITKSRCILVCGDADDYLLELEDLIAQHVGARAGSAFVQSKPWRAAARLLSHLENDKTFTKFVKRYFEDFEVTQAWRRLTKRRTALEKLHLVETTNDLKVLRDALILAEEVCDNDPDGGDLILGSARDKLQRLEEEHESKQLKEQERALKELKEAESRGDTNKLRISLLLAEKIFQADPEQGDCVLGSARERLRCMEKEANTDARESSATVPFVGAAVGSVEAEKGPDSGRGRGRGRTLPAWMTAGNGPLPAAEMTANVAVGTGHGDKEKQPLASSDVPGAVSDEGPAVDNRQPSQTKRVPSNTCDDPFVGSAMVNAGNEMGRGRGRSRTMPAWMTSSGGPQAAIVESKDSEEATAQAQECLLESAPNHPAQAEAKSILSTILEQNSGGAFNTGSDRTQKCDISFNNAAAAHPPSETMAASGRGRGVSRTLPAWMTSQDVGQKRSRSPNNEANDDIPCKRYREIETPQQSFEYTIKLVIDPKQEQDFVKWLEPTLDTEAQARGGSATVNRSQFED
eukprot:Sro146_g067520.2  (654) ;mRNA; f:42256-44217